MADFFETMAQNLRQALGTAVDTAAFWGGGGPYEGRLGPHSTLRLDGDIFPGVKSWDDPGACPVEIDSGELMYRIDVQRVKNKGGHRLVVEGYQPTPINAKVKIVTPAQWAAYRAYLGKISPKLQPEKRHAFLVDHPILTPHGIRSVYINRLSFPREAESRMIKEVTLTMWEAFDLDEKAGGGKVISAADDSGIKVAQPFQNVDGQVDVEERSPKLKHSGRSGGRR